MYSPATQNGQEVDSQKDGEGIATGTKYRLRTDLQLNDTRLQLTKRMASSIGSLVHLNIAMDVSMTRNSNEDNVFVVTKKSCMKCTHNRMVKTTGRKSSESRQ